MSIGGVTVIDDYAHHPTEIEATLKAAANYPHRKLWCVFQPHTYTRTKAYLKEFARSLCLANSFMGVVVYDGDAADGSLVLEAPVGALVALQRPCRQAAVDVQALRHSEGRQGIVHIVLAGHA